MQMEEELLAARRKREVGGEKGLGIRKRAYVQCMKEKAASC